MARTTRAILDEAIGVGHDIRQVNDAIDAFVIAWRNKNLRKDKFEVFEEPMFRDLSAIRESFRDKLVALNKELSS